MVSRRSSTETSKETYSAKKKLHKKEKRFITGRQVAWMTYEYFKVSDTDESVSDFNEMLKVELKNHNVQLFDTRGVETILAMKQTDDEKVEHVYFRQCQHDNIQTCCRQ